MTHNDGTTLEKYALELFRLSQVHNLESQKRVGHKKVDIFFESRNMGFPYRNAVECKDYNRRLTLQDVVEITTDYSGLLVREIDRILLITRKGLSTDAAAYISEQAFLSHLTIEEMELELIDFANYVSWQAKEFKDDETFSYYVPCEAIEVVNGSHSARFVFEDKFVSELELSKQPFALIGSYGLGKTTTLKSLFQIYAKEYLAEKHRPIPVYIPLSKVSSEQSIEGLLGKMFTSTHVVRGYNFSLFKFLNHSGRIVLFLDGFDEMRHKLSWEQFEFILSELGILTSNNHQAVFAGRPTAFLSAEEYDFAIKGKSKSKIRIFKEDVPAYREVILQEFARPQVESFVSHYATHDASFNHYQQMKFWDFYDKSKNVRDIASRPVQLYMITQILPVIGSDVKELTSGKVYDLFLDELIARDMRKPSRREFGKDVRREFAADVAWWLWNTATEMRVTAMQIPSEVIEKFRKSDEDIETVRRELVIGSFMSSERGESVFFPHRSLQEYLTAEKFVYFLKSDPLKCEGLLRDDLLTDEVADFVRQILFEEHHSGVDRRELLKRPFGADAALKSYELLLNRSSEWKGHFDIRLLEMFSGHERLVSAFFSEYLRKNNVFGLMLSAYCVLYDKLFDYLKEKVRDLIFESLLKKYRYSQSINEHKAEFFYPTLLLAILLGNTEQLSRLFLAAAPFIRSAGLSKYLTYENKGEAINISALYKQISSQINRSLIPSQWIVGEFYRVDNYVLPQRVADPMRAIWALLVDIPASEKPKKRSKKLGQGIGRQWK